MKQILILFETTWEYHTEEAQHYWTEIYVQNKRIKHPVFRSKKPGVTLGYAEAWIKENFNMKDIELRREPFDIGRAQLTWPQIICSRGFDQHLTYRLGE